MRLVASLGLVALAVAALGTGAGHSAPGGSAQAGGIIINGTTDAITNIDPAGAYDYPSFAAAILIYEHLLDFKNTTRLQPSLATRCFAVGGNLRRWRCNLRRNVEFHDGSAFDSADVKHSFDRVIRINDPSGISSLLGNLASTTTNGRYAVTFNLKSPQSTWPQILATGAAFIVPSTYPANRLQANNQPQVGTGPYRLTRYTAGQQAVFERFDDYWGPAARNEGVILRQYARSSTQKLALERGEIDMAFNSGALPPVELDSLKRNRNVRVHQGVGVSIRYLNFNVTRSPFNNVAVRRAVAYLMPRQTIASRVYRGYVRPLFSMPPAGMPGHIDAFASVYGRGPNVAAARRVLQQAGVQTPVAADIWYTPTRYGDASADEYAEIKRALDRSGLFRVTLKSSEWAQYSDVLGRQYNAFQLGWFPDYVDVENYIVPFYRSDTFLATGYKNARVDRLIRVALATRSQSARFRVYRQIQLLVARDASTIPYWQGDMIAPARRNIVGIPSTLDAAFIMRYWKLQKV
jgi:peptide/nickel transport system substrate-binding protein